MVHGSFRVGTVGLGRLRPWDTSSRQWVLGIGIGGGAHVGYRVAPLGLGRLPVPGRGPLCLVE